MKLKNAKCILLASAIFIQLIWYGLSFGQRISQPDSYKQIDFSIYYTAGRIANTGHYSLIYDIETQRVIRQELLNIPIEATTILPFNHPPLFVPLIQIITDENFVASYWRWVAVLITFLVSTMVVLDQLMRTEKISQGSRWLLILISVLFFPIFVSLFRGQDSIIMLLGLMLWLYGLVTGLDALSGAGLALTILRPHIAIMLAFPFIFRRRKVWWWFCGVVALLVLYCFILLGWNGIQDYLIMLGISAQGQGYEINQQGMLNFIGLAIRLFPRANINILHFISWGLFIASVIGLSVWWKRSSEIGFSHIIMATTMSVFVAPHLHYHDLTFLLIPCLGMGLAAIRVGRLNTRDFAGLLTLVSVSLMVSSLSKPIFNIIPYFWMAALIIGVVCLQYKTRGFIIPLIRESK